MDGAQAGPTYRFGSFELDVGRRRLQKNGQLLPLPDRQFDVLMVLCAAGGRLVSKNDLADAAWHGVAVSDNSIDKAISSLRQVLERPPDPAPIEIRKRVGVRLSTPVMRVKETRAAASPVSPVAIDALLQPFEAFIDGRTAFETFDRSAVDDAHRAFSEALRLDPDIPAAHIGLANALLLRFEATRADDHPDRTALGQALHHAFEACRLDPWSAEAWGTLAWVRQESGAGTSAVAAARKAVHLAPHAWRHHLRLASVSWGSERLGAALKVLSLSPGAALGHWFAATVHIARQAFSQATDHLRAGCAARDTQPKEGGRSTAVGLHLLHGLVRSAQGDLAAARDDLSRELTLDNPDHVDVRECAANTWCALGALALREEHRDEARTSFREALSRVPGHAMASVGLAFAENRPIDIEQIPNLSSPIDTAIVRAAALVLRGRHADAAGICVDALRAAVPGSAGYLLPVEPLLGAARRRDVWEPALAAVANRAS
jgi:DNA-binding winged helix-turn-helix (wHTH) protein/Tfp pilus assembly protein PilF